MKKLCSVAALAFMFACASTHHSDDQQATGGNDQDHGNTDNGGSGSGSGSSAAACPLGAASFTSVIAADAAGLTAVGFAIDLNDQAFVANAGIFQVSATGEVTAGLPAGSLVATDALGNVFVAGSFTSRIDFGNNIVLNPMGNIDVFVAEIDVKGNVVFAKALDVCGDGIAALAIGKDGRIAVSGSAMGTLVLDAQGNVMFTFQAFGKIAFDSQDDLVIAGIDVSASAMVVSMFDVNGQAVFSQSFSTAVSVGGVAIDANDRIAIVGVTSSTIDLFGTKVVAGESAEVGRTTGAFLLVLDRSCNFVMARDLGMVEANGVAFDLAGNIFVAGANTSAQAFDRLIAVVEVEASGRLGVVAAVGEDNGRALAVAVDACGALFVALTHQVPNGGINPLELQVMKIAL